MQGTNAFSGFVYDGYEDFDFSELPKGKFLTFALNPYNGNCIVGYNRSPVALEVATDLLEYMHLQIGVISDALGVEAGMSELMRYLDGKLELGRFEECPFCGCVPEYVDGSGEVVCCGGRTHVGGFSSRSDAVRFWNDRARTFKVA